MAIDGITPKKYKEMKDKQTAIINCAKRIINQTYEIAKEYPLPENLRSAAADDIKINNIIWYPKNEHRDFHFWKIVEEVLYPSDPWKAYLGEDGCRYGLRGAFVETKY